MTLSASIGTTKLVLLIYQVSVRAGYIQCNVERTPANAGARREIA